MISRIASLNCRLPASAAVLSIAICVGWGLSKVRGDEPQSALPKDGAWVRYQKEIVDRKGGKMSHAVTLSFVGSATDDDKPCRWVEVKVVVPEGERQPPGSYVTKMLIPEKELLEVEDPTAYAVRTWFRKPKDPVAREGSVGFTTGPHLFLWSPAAIKKMSQSEDQVKDIEYLNGKLKGAEVWTGKATTVRAKSRFEANYTIVRHPDLPIGFAEAKIIDNLFVDGMFTGQQVNLYRLEDAGTDAKSELPDSD